MSGLLDELRWRGFVHEATPGIEAHLAAPRRVYCGFDPTAPSLQVGNLMPLMLLRHFQQHGHTPIVLMGGGTGLIGDPAGKRTERPLLSREQVRTHPVSTSQAAGTIRPLKAPIPTQGEIPSRVCSSSQQRIENASMRYS